MKFMQDARQGGTSNDIVHDDGAPSFRDYFAKKPEPTEFTEEQLAFRRRSDSPAAATTQHPSEFDYTDDVPEFD